MSFHINRNDPRVQKFANANQIRLPIYIRASYSPRHRQKNSLQNISWNNTLNGLRSKTDCCGNQVEITRHPAVTPEFIENMLVFFLPVFKDCQFQCGFKYENQEIRINIGAFYSESKDYLHPDRYGTIFFIVKKSEIFLESIVGSGHGYMSLLLPALYVYAQSMLLPRISFGVGVNNLKVQEVLFHLDFGRPIDNTSLGGKWKVDVQLGFWGKLKQIALAAFSWIFPR